MNYLFTQIRRFLDWRLKHQLRYLRRQYGNETVIPVEKLRTAYRFHIDEPGVILCLFDFSDALFDLDVVHAADWSTLRHICEYAARSKLDSATERGVWQILSAPEPKVVFLNMSVRRGEISNTVLSEHRDAIEALLAKSCHSTKLDVVAVHGLVGTHGLIA